jgi:hypothetical protein
MGSKDLGYVIAGVEFLAAAVLIFVPGMQPMAAALAISAAATFVGTALQPQPPRSKQLRDSSTYGIDKFDNPRGPDVHVAILYGEHRIKPNVIVESVLELAEAGNGGTPETRTQQFRWLGAGPEGEIAEFTEIEINDRPIFSDLHDEKLGKGNGTKKEFTFPHGRIFLGDDEAPAVEVYVAGVKKSWLTQSATAEFTVPSGSGKYSVVIERDGTGGKQQRILGRSLRVFVRGQGYAEREQFRTSGTYHWSAQKVSRYKHRIRFHTRPAAGFTVRVTYDYLTADGLTIVQDAKGVTKAVFGSAVANNAEVTAKYRTTAFRGLQFAFRPGTLDQQPIDGFTDLEQSRNPATGTLMTKDAQVPGSTDGREVDNLRFGFVAPQGLVQYHSDGGTSAVTVNVKIEYRLRNTATFKTLQSSTGETFVLTGERSGTIRWEVDLRDELEKRAIAGDSSALDELGAFDRGSYEFQCTRKTARSTDPLVTDEVHFMYWTEVLHQGFSYPGTSLLGLRGIPTGFLSGQTLRISAKARRAALYDPRTDSHGGARDLGSSQNAALAIRDLITSAEGVARERYGGGYFFTGTDLFLGADGNPAELNGLIAFADFCDEWVHRPGDDASVPASATNGERRCRLNLMLDTPQSLVEAVGDIAFLGYGFAAAQGARWRFPLDQDGDAVFTFVDDVDPAHENMRKFNLRIDEWAKSPTAIRGSFWNELTKYQRDEMYVPVDGVAAGAATNVREVNLAGCTRETEAARMLRHLAEQARAAPFPCTWEADPGVQHVEAGDIVTVRTRVPFSTGATASELKVRVLAGMVGREEDGKLVVRYAGRVMESSVYALDPVTLPASRFVDRSRSTTTAAAAERPQRRVRNLSARVVRR